MRIIRVATILSLALSAPLFAQGTAPARAADAGLRAADGKWRPASGRGLLVFAPDRFPYGSAEAVISRAPGEQDVLLVPTASPSAEVINRALDQLAMIRAIEGETATRPALYRVSGRGPVRNDNGFARMVAANLRHAQRSQINGLDGVSLQITPNRASISVQRSGGSSRLKVAMRQ